MEQQEDVIRSCDADLSNGLLLSMWWICLFGQDLKFNWSKPWLLI